MRNIVIALLILMPLLPGCTTVPNAREGDAAPQGDSWEFSLTPYAWAAGVKGDVTVRNIATSTDASFGDVLDALDGGLMAHLEASKGDWAFFADGLYLRLSDDAKGPRGFLKADVELEQAVLELGGVYRVWQRTDGDGRKFSAGVLAGARYNYLKGMLDLTVGPRSFEREGSKDWVDPFVGARATFDLTKRLELTLRGDVGGFGVGSEFTWNAIAGLGYRLSETTTLRAGYRILDVDFDHGSFSYDVRTAGPWLGFSWWF
jgi:hypothetical protein